MREDNIFLLRDGDPEQVAKAPGHARTGNWPESACQAERDTFDS